MSERMLFSIIGMLLFSIAGIGGYAAWQHPDVVATIPSNATNAVSSAVSDATNTITKTASAQSTVSFNRDSDRDGDTQTDSDDDDESSQSAQAPAASTGGTKSSGSTQSGAHTYTMAQIAQHNSAASCYTTIQGGVYNLTSFINQHPGGRAAILSLCGIDGTSAFMAQHGGQGRPEQELASLKIGTLAQ